MFLFNYVHRSSSNETFDRQRRIFRDVGKHCEIRRLSRNYSLNNYTHTTCSRFLCYIFSFFFSFFFFVFLLAIKNGMSNYNEQ